MSWTDLRFLVDRASGLARRGMVSLRQRGIHATWQRVLRQFERVPAAQRPPLYRPEPLPFTPFAVPGAPAPAASIVIPVYNQFGHTLECLRAIAAHPPAAPVEVIVVDDGSADETLDALPQVHGLRYHRRATNGGFIAACNDGAGLARGDVLVFLNNDTVPQPGWLDALLDTFKSHPGTGLAGAQLLYPDGRLQEAGGVVFSDGSAANCGRFSSADAPPWAYVREVDYCSGAAIAVPRTVFEALGRFDTRYAPAYFEDTDLAFQVKAMGLKVLYQPAARVVHLEGATAGTDVRQGAKRHQQRNQQVFARKWASALQGQPSPRQTEDACAAPARRQVLVLDSAMPDTARDSGSVRLINLMHLLRDEGAHVTFFSASLEPLGTAARRLQQSGVEVWYRPYATGVPAWLKANGRRFDTVLVCRYHLTRELLPLLRRHAPQARVVFDSVDLHHLREQRAAELAGDAALLRAAAQTRELELDAVRRSDATLVVSEVERALLRDLVPGARVAVLSNLHRLPPPGAGFRSRRDVVFVGGFRHPPNVDAVMWFASAVWPQVRAAHPSLVLHVVGDDVPPALRALDGRDGIRIHGHVPELAPLMEGVRVAVAPLRFGAGVKGKINLSMAHGQPVVATSCAVEAMHLRDGEDVLVADDAEAFAEAVVRLHDDEALWTRLATQGRENVARHFSFDAARPVVREVLLPERG